MEVFEFIPPTDEQIAQAQEKLNFTFSNEYIEFIKSGYNLEGSVLQSLEIVNPPSYVDIYQVQSEAREFDNLPENLLPICEDNSDYYCLNELGEVIFWSHNGSTDDKWGSVKEWISQMIEESCD